MFEGIFSAGTTGPVRPPGAFVLPPPMRWRADRALWLLMLRADSRADGGIGRIAEWLLPSRFTVLAAAVAGG